MPATPSSSTELEACCRIAIFAIERRAGVRRSRSESRRTPDARTIREMPSARRLIPDHMWTPEEEEGPILIAGSGECQYRAPLWAGQRRHAAKGLSRANEGPGIGSPRSIDD